MVRASAPGSGKPGSFPFGAITSRSDSVGAAGALCSGRAVSGSGGGRGGSMGGGSIWATSRSPASDLTASLLATWTRVGRGLRATLWRPLRRPSRIAPLVMMRVELPQWRAVTPRLATSGPASSAAGPFPPCGPKPRSARASSRVFDPRADQDLQRLRLLQRIDRVVADPHKLEPGLVHALPDHMVERVLDPRLERHNPFLRRLLAQGLARRPVDLRYEGERIWTPVMRYRVASASRRAGDQRVSALVAKGPWAGMIGSSGLSDQGTPFSGEICSSAPMEAGVSLLSP